MEDWKKVLISPRTRIKETIKIIELHSLQIALVVDEDNKLLGTVTDGDIRRGILNGLSLEDSVQRIMNKNPVSIPVIKDKNNIINILKVNKLRHLPVVDEAGAVIGIERLEDLLHPAKKDNWVVLMTGGRGSRLRPLTETCPKPMLPIGGRPLLETSLVNFREQGFHRFCFAINYKGEQIKDYFQDGSRWGVEIRYIEEIKEMGTIGSLSMFSIATEKPIIVMNGDILTKVNFEQLVGFHLEHQVQATVAVRPYDFQIPYGVVKVNRDRLVGFEEKPVYTSFINAGVYVLNPAVLSKIPRDAYFDMDELLAMMLKDDEQIAIFPIREYWMDIGEMDDLQQAKLDYAEVFK